MGIKCRILADQRAGCSENGETQIAIVDASAACHMPDVLEMPYLPPLLGTDEKEESGITVRLGGRPACQEM